MKADPMPDPDPDAFFDERSDPEADVSTKNEPKRYRFPLTKFDDLRPGTDALFIIKPIIPRFGITLVWGKAKCGKSFWVGDLTMYVAAGWEYRGHRVMQGPVVYCAFEGADGFKLRAEAFRRQHPDMPSGVPFYLINASADLINDHPAMIGDIKAQLGEERPLVVVLDTLNRSLRGSESSDEDMADYVRAADAIREALGCAVVIIHHCGHDDKRPRGHSSLLGAIDAQIAVTRDDEKNIIATVERMKDGPEGATIKSRLEQIEVGTDTDGDQITSCKVIALDDAESAKPELDSKKAKKVRPREMVAGVKLSSTNHIAFSALKQAIEDAGEEPPASNRYPRGIKAVRSSLWRKYFYLMRGTHSQEANQKAFLRASDDLQAEGLIRVELDHVWTLR